MRLVPPAPCPLILQLSQAQYQQTDLESLEHRLQDPVPHPPGIKNRKKNDFKPTK